MKNILFLDTETNGLPGDPNQPYTNHANWPEIMSIAWLIVDDNARTLSEHRYIIAPRPGIANSAEHINGITPEIQAKEGTEISLVLEVLKRCTEEAIGAVCHNVAFDQPVLFAEFDRLNIEPPEIDWYCTKEAAAPLCRIPNTSSRYPGQWKWPSLDELHAFLFGEPIAGREQFHDAMIDVKATARCYFEMQRRFGHTEATIL